MHIDTQFSKSLNNKLKFAITANIAFTIFEFLVGITSGSLALISDACHNLTDVLSLVISFIAHKIAQKRPDTKKTFGYGRATILAALLNVVILSTLAGYIFTESYKRFYNPEPISELTVIITGLLGILINGGIALLFLKYKDDLNIRSALINMTFDAVASAGALASGIIIWLTNKTFVDSLISAAIGSMLLISAYNILKDIINILLEGVPKNINLHEVKKEIKAIPLVKDINRIHIWEIASYYIALSCHIIIDQENLNQSIKIVKDIKQVLKNKFNIKHATIEIDIINT